MDDVVIHGLFPQTKHLQLWLKSWQSSSFFIAKQAHREPIGRAYA
jgi:hypothetical protein